MNKLFFVFCLILISSLLFGCTDSFAQSKNYCGNYCEAKVGVDRCVNNSNGNIKSECAECVHSCLRELEGGDFNG